MAGGWSNPNCSNALHELFRFGVVGDLSALARFPARPTDGAGSGRA